jgi:hypothetical protein
MFEFEFPTGTAVSAASWERPGVVGMDDLAMAKPARFVPRRSACHDPAMGIEPGFEPIGAGNLAAGQGDPESALSCGILSGD